MGNSKAKPGLSPRLASAYIVHWQVDTIDLNRIGWNSSIAMLNEVYNRRIIELAGTIPRIGRLPAPDASATAHSRLCGSTVTVDLKMDGDTVTDFAHEVKACALGQHPVGRDIPAGGVLDEEDRVGNGVE